MTNDEIRRNDEIRMSKPAIAPLSAFRHSGFGFLSSFVIQRLAIQPPSPGKQIPGILLDRADRKIFSLCFFVWLLQAA